MLRGNEQRTQQNPTEPTHGIHRAPWLGPNEREIYSRDSTNVSPRSTRRSAAARNPGIFLGCWWEANHAHFVARMCGRGPQSIRERDTTNLRAALIIWESVSNGALLT